MSASLKEQIQEVKRELWLRKQVYPGLIAKGKLTRDQANRQYGRLYAVLQTLYKLQSKEQPTLFDQPPPNQAERHERAT